MGLSNYFVIPNFSNQTFDVVIDQSSMAELTLEDGIFAFIFIGVGLFSVFLGYMFYQLTFLLAGVYFGYIVTYPILTGAGVEDPVTAFAVAMTIGLLAGLLMIFVWRIGVMVVGAVAGYLFATFMIGFCHNTVLAQSPGNYIFTGVCCLLGLILGLLLASPLKVILIVTTSCLGSYFFFYGLDVLLAGLTGFAATFDGALSLREAPRGFTPRTWGMLGGCIGLALIGLVCQFLATGRPLMLGGGSCCSKWGSPGWSRRQSKENKHLKRRLTEVEARVIAQTPFNG